MTDPILDSARAAADVGDVRLKKVARQLEGVFVEQLFKAMRETVPEGGLYNGGAGEEIFTSMMDQHLAGEVPNDWERGLGAALYRQLRGAAAGEDVTDTALPAPGGEV